LHREEFDAHVVIASVPVGPVIVRRPFDIVNVGVVLVLFELSVAEFALLTVMEKVLFLDADVVNT
jgi:RNase P/RNase MRP subunit p30